MPFEKFYLLRSYAIPDNSVRQNVCIDILNVNEILELPSSLWKVINFIFVNIQVLFKTVI